MHLNGTKIFKIVIKCRNYSCFPKYQEITFAYYLNFLIISYFLRFPYGPRMQSYRRKNNLPRIDQGKVISQLDM